MQCAAPAPGLVVICFVGGGGFSSLLILVVAVLVVGRLTKIMVIKTKLGSCISAAILNCNKH